MGKDKPRIAIVGLGLIGGSIGMALRQADVASAVIGHDKDPNTSKKAKKLGAVTGTDWNLVSTCETSDLIILAIPVDGIEDTLKAIAPYLRPGTLIMDTASLKEPVLAWADEILPDHVHFVGANPIISEPDSSTGGLDAAQADLFQNRLFCLVPSVKADPDVVQLASNVVAILGARPLYVDAAEHDGLMGGVDQLPSLMALALLEATSGQPSWRELRKVAGATFETSTHLASNDPETYSELFLANRDNLIRWMNALSASLDSLRQELLEAEPKALTDRFEHLMEERNRWLRDREGGQWDEAWGPDMPAKPNLIGDMFLGGLGRKRAKKDS